MITSAPRQSGFSFIELVIALALFAVATSVIVGLESSSIDRTLRDRNAQQAMLVTRRIMASIEAAGSKLELADQQDQPVLEILRALGVPDADDRSENPAVANFRVSLTLVDWELPFENVQNPAMRKASLIVAWGPGRGERFEVDYLFPRDPGV